MEIYSQSVIMTSSQRGIVSNIYGTKRIIINVLCVQFWAIAITTVVSVLSE